MKVLLLLFAFMIIVVVNAGIYKRRYVNIHGQENWETTVKRGVQNNPNREISYNPAGTNNYGQEISPALANSYRNSAPNWGRTDNQEVTVPPSLEISYVQGKTNGGNTNYNRETNAPNWQNSYLNGKTNGVNADYYKESNVPGRQISYINGKINGANTDYYRETSAPSWQKPSLYGQQTNTGSTDHHGPTNLGSTDYRGETINSGWENAQQQQKGNSGNSYDNGEKYWGNDDRYEGSDEGGRDSEAVNYERPNPKNIYGSKTVNVPFHFEKSDENEQQKEPIDDNKEYAEYEDEEEVRQTKRNPDIEGRDNRDKSLPWNYFNKQPFYIFFPEIGSDQ